MELVIIEFENGEVRSVKREQGDLIETVKKYVRHAVDQWNAEFSDFVVLKDSMMIRLPLPLPPELRERLRAFGLRRVENAAVCDLPVYEIVYDSQWVGDDLRARRMLVVAPYVSEEVTETLLSELRRAVRGE